MDASNLDIGRLSDQDRQELQQFIQRTQSQAGVHELVSTLTKNCWKKCIQSPINQGKLSKSEESCAQNCVARWFESQKLVASSLQNQRMSPLG